MRNVSYIWTFGSLYDFLCFDECLVWGVARVVDHPKMCYLHSVSFFSKSISSQILIGTYSYLEHRKVFIVDLNSMAPNPRATASGQNLEQPVYSISLCLGNHIS